MALNEPKMRSITGKLVANIIGKTKSTNFQNEKYKK